MNDQPNQPDSKDESKSPSHKTYRLSVTPPSEDPGSQPPESKESDQDGLDTPFMPETIIESDKFLDADSGNGDVASSLTDQEPGPESPAELSQNTPGSDSEKSPSSSSSTSDHSSAEETATDDDVEDNSATSPAVTKNGLQEKPSIPALNERLVSLDALRGFSMFWIVGAHELFTALTNLLRSDQFENVPAGVKTVLSFITIQLEHVSWEGFHFIDLIFPMFVFIIGASMVFSINKRRQTDTKLKIFSKILWRTLFLYCLGLFYYAGDSRIVEAGDLRYMGVLQRLALTYGITATLYLFFPLRALIIGFAIILMGYYGAVAFVPFEGSSDLTSQERFEEGADKNLVNNFDKNYLGGYKWGGKDYDPEGLLSNIPAVGSCLLGVFAGLILINPDKKKIWKINMLLLSGVVSLLLAFVWGLFFPIIKNLWTSSFVLMAGGWSLLLLAFFYLVIDTWKFSFWAIPFVWIGSNAITIYLGWQIIDFQSLAERIVQFNIASTLGIYSELVTWLVAVCFALALLRFLHSKKIFLRV